MYPTRYDRPSSRFPTLFDELFRDDFFNRFLGQREAGRTGGEPAAWAPAVNIKETDKEFVISADLPGVNKEDIKVNVDKGVLTIQAESRAEESHEGEIWHLTERRYGVFQRSFRLPETVNSDQIQAHHRNGVLELVLPKTQTAAARQIQIQA